MPPADLIYRLVLRTAPAALRLAAPFSDKVRRGLEGRRGCVQSLLEWAAESRDDGRPLVWLHAPSVGEALMAQAILSSVRELEPEVQSAFTFFSPSAERVAPRVGADWSGYLPWDRAGEMTAAVSALKPAAVAFVRTEIWPVLVSRVRATGARAVLVNAVLTEDSSRLGAPARALLGPAYRALDAVGAVHGEDAARFARLGVEPSRVRVTGDARFDQVWERVRRLDRDRPLLRRLRGGGPWLVAGSTWPSDEERLVPVLAELKRNGSGWQSIIAPHEPTMSHVRGLESRLDAAGLTHRRLPADDDEGDTSPVEVVVVDRVGVLADLYSVASLAYVGGGFGSAGLHSVVEPAALGVPVAYGPNHGNASEATRLEHALGGFVVTDDASLLRLFERMRRDAAYREEAGLAAREFVRANIGGARRNAALVLGVPDEGQWFGPENP